MNLDSLHLNEPPNMGVIYIYIFTYTYIIHIYIIHIYIFLGMVESPGHPPDIFSISQLKSSLSPKKSHQILIESPWLPMTNPIKKLMKSWWHPHEIPMFGEIPLDLSMTSRPPQQLPKASARPRSSAAWALCRGRWAVWYSIHHH